MIAIDRQGLTMTDEVKRWLEGLGLGEHLQAFVDNEIDLETAGELNEQDRACHGAA
jgi:hypothetical protein